MFLLEHKTRSVIRLLLAISTHDPRGQMLELQLQLFLIHLWFARILSVHSLMHRHFEQRHRQRPKIHELLSVDLSGIVLIAFGPNFLLQLGLQDLLQKLDKFLIVAIHQSNRPLLQLLVLQYFFLSQFRFADCGILISFVCFLCFISLLTSTLHGCSWLFVHFFIYCCWLSSIIVGAFRLLGIVVVVVVLVAIVFMGILIWSYRVRICVILII
mmetsp:Transcript_35918/g.57740  ORF Transcript_35918/g.57740 Transcript_35918/m.57740 type:complete len:213 (-) Transcript_35918:315-953(-)